MSHRLLSRLAGSRAVRCLVLGAVLATAVAFGLATEDPIDASPCFEIERVYYSDASHTTIVGGLLWPCNGPREQWGTVTSFVEIFSEPCPGCFA